MELMASTALFIVSLVLLKCNQQQKEIEVLKEVLSKYINEDDQQRIGEISQPTQLDRKKRIQLTIILILLLIVPFLIITLNR